MSSGERKAVVLKTAGVPTGRFYVVTLDAIGRKKHALVIGICGCQILCFMAIEAFNSKSFVPEVG